MPTQWQRVRLEIPKQLKPVDREQVASEIIDFIIDRSKQGKNKNGRNFPKYTKEYAKFKGVSRDAVDLTLDDEMLNEMQLLSHKSGELLIGYERGSDENAKADGNIRGTYGKPSPIPGKARDFLGISKTQLQRIVREYLRGKSEAAD